MTANVGNIDRLIRLIIAVAAIAFAFFGPFAAPGWGWEKIALLGVGGIMLLTSSIKFCPIYRIFGLRTCPVD